MIFAAASLLFGVAGIIVMLANRRGGSGFHAIVFLQTAVYWSVAYLVVLLFQLLVLIIMRRLKVDKSTHALFFLIFLFIHMFIGGFFVFLTDF